MNGKRAGERQGKRSHVRELRAWLWRAGIHRPLPGFDEAFAAYTVARERLETLRGKGEKGKVRKAQNAAREAEEPAKALDELQAGSDRYQPVDFHSFRPQFNTALATAGVNVQPAMALAEHRDPRTHARYVLLAQRGVLTAPDAALPKVLSASSMQKSEPENLPSIANPAVLEGDPNEIRTRVTGVRERPVRPDGNAASRTSGKTAASDVIVTPRDPTGRGHGHDFMADNRGTNLLDRELADRLLAMALRGMAARLLLGRRSVGVLS